MSIVMAVIALFSSAVCVGFAPTVIEATGKKDPGEVVVDEVAGQAITFLAIGAMPVKQVWLVAVMGFVLFRIFDITKPWPIRKLETFPKGWGILADDLLAGVYAWIALHVCIKFFICG